jgi:hypothetical protein
MLRRLHRAAVLAVALAAISGLAAGLYGLAYGLCFAAVSGTLAGVLPCALYFALAGAAAGGIVGAFGTLIGGEPVEPGVPDQVQRRDQAVADKVARKSAVRVWTEEKDEPDLFFPPPPESSRQATNRKDRQWT